MVGLSIIGREEVGSIKEDVCVGMVIYERMSLRGSGQFVKLVGVDICERVVTSE